MQVNRSVSEKFVVSREVISFIPLMIYFSKVFSNIDMLQQSR